MAEETQKTANTGIVTISTANSALDGTGAVTLITGGSNGTFIPILIIKAQTSTNDGMVRIFVNDGHTSTRLIVEIPIPAITKASINKTFEIFYPLNYKLPPGYVLMVTTEKADTFNVIALGQDWSYYATSVRADTTQFTANTGFTSDATANSNLNGTGTLGFVYTAGSAVTYKGSYIRSITVKATVNNTPGMVRLYIYNGTTKFLFKEVVIPSITKTGTDKAFQEIISFVNEEFKIKAGYSIYASTEKAENFNLLVEGADVNYAA